MCTSFIKANQFFFFLHFHLILQKEKRRYEFIDYHSYLSMDLTVNPMQFSVNGTKSVWLSLAIWKCQSFQLGCYVVTADTKGNDGDNVLPQILLPVLSEIFQILALAFLSWRNIHIKALHIPCTLTIRLIYW